MRKRSVFYSPLVLCLILAGATALGGEEVRPFAKARKSKDAHLATVILTDPVFRELEIGEAEVTVRKNLKITLFVPETDRNREIAFSDIAEFRLTVLEEGLEKEWRWKEGGLDEKIYTGRAYPWRKHGIEVKLRSGETVSARLVSGFPLKIAFANASLLKAAEQAAEKIRADETTSAEERKTVLAAMEKLTAKSRDEEGWIDKQSASTPVVSPKTKGEMGQSLAELTYVKSVAFAPAVKDAQKDAQPAPQ